MPDIALYYPWTRVRDETWLKAAALYWPRLAVLAPPGYPHIESATGRRLRDDLDFFVDADPTRHAGDLATEFTAVISQHPDELIRRYAGLTSRLPDDYYRYADRDFREGRPDNDSITWLHIDKMAPTLAETLIGLGLAALNRDSLALHPRLAAVYLTALADSVRVIHRTG